MSRSRNGSRSRSRDDIRSRPLEISSERRDESVEIPKSLRLYVGNLPFQTTNDEFRDLMTTVGAVSTADVLVSFGRSKGCGIVEYEDMSSVEAAMSQIHGSSFGGRTLFIREDRMPERKRFNDSMKDDRVNCTCYVGNLPYSVSWQDLKDLFRDAGHVVRADVPQTPDRQSKGFGIIVYERPEDVDRAISMFDGVDFQGRQLQVRPDRNQSEQRPRRRQRSYSPRRSRSRERSYRRREEPSRSRSTSRGKYDRYSRSPRRVKRDYSEERHSRRERRSRRHESNRYKSRSNSRYRSSSPMRVPRENSVVAENRLPGTEQMPMGYMMKDPKTGQPFMMPFPYGFYPFGFDGGSAPSGTQPTPQQMLQLQQMQQMYMQQQQHLVPSSAHPISSSSVHDEPAEYL